MSWSAASQPTHGTADGYSFRNPANMVIIRLSYELISCAPTDSWDCWSILPQEPCQHGHYEDSVSRSAASQPTHGTADGYSLLYPANMVIIRLGYELIASKPTDSWDCWWILPQEPCQHYKAKVWADRQRDNQPMWLLMDTPSETLPTWSL